jgi:hypothetical protein
MRPVPDAAVMPSGITGCVLRASHGPAFRRLHRGNRQAGLAASSAAIREIRPGPYIAYGEPAVTMSLEPRQTD